MILDLILGNNIDTKMWISFLKTNGSDSIAVLDYDFFEDPKSIDGVLYFSNLNITAYLKNFDTINFYKSLYCFPGMSGNMSSLYNKKQ